MEETKLSGFGQVVIGPAGSGKSTYCKQIKATYTTLKRPSIIISLDPANISSNNSDNATESPFDIDINELITIEEIMATLHLGPNGAILYAMEYLEKNLDWLISRIAAYTPEHYLLFDLPGQIELFTHHNSLKNILARLVKSDLRLCAVQLVDAHHCTDPSKYISVLLQSLKMMIQLDLPHVNVLSKVDLVDSYGKLAFPLDFYTDVQDLNYLVDILDRDPKTAKYAKLNRAICDLVSEFSLVGFYPICIDDPESVLRVLRVVDKANGWVFGGLEGGNESIFAAAARDIDGSNVLDIAERYMKEKRIEEDQDTSREDS